MAVYQRTNFGKSIVGDNPLTAGATTVNITAGDGSKFPSSGNFPLVIWDKITYIDPSDDPSVEIVLATARSTDTITITRAQENTSAVEHAKESAIEELITAGVFTDLTDQNLKTSDSPTFTTLTTTGGRIVNTTRITSNTTLNNTHHNIFCDTDSGSFTVTLPAGVDGTYYRIINTGSSGNTITLTPNGSEKLLGINSSILLLDGNILIIVFETTEHWW